MEFWEQELYDIGWIEIPINESIYGSTPRDIAAVNIAFKAAMNCDYCYKDYCCEHTQQGCSKLKADTNVIERGFYYELPEPVTMNLYLLDIYCPIRYTDCYVWYKTFTFRITNDHSAKFTGIYVFETPRKSRMVPTGLAMVIVSGGDPPLRPICPGNTFRLSPETIKRTPELLELYSSRRINSLNPINTIEELKEYTRKTHFEYAPPGHELIEEKDQEVF
jgi:hypothetical protein